MSSSPKNILPTTAKEPEPHVPVISHGNTLSTPRAVQDDQSMEPQNSSGSSGPPKDEQPKDEASDNDKLPDSGDAEQDIDHDSKGLQLVLADNPPPRASYALVYIFLGLHEKKRPYPADVKRHSFSRPVRLEENDTLTDFERRVKRTMADFMMVDNDEVAEWASVCITCHAAAS